jgi:hypothetical protein
MVTGIFFATGGTGRPWDIEAPEILAEAGRAEAASAAEAVASRSRRFMVEVPEMTADLVRADASPSNEQDPLAP